MVTNARLRLYTTIYSLWGDGHLYCENYELCQIRIAMNLTGVLIRELSIKIDNPYTALAANSNILSFITIVNRIN
jgi:hypothetical protein